MSVLRQKPKHVGNETGWGLKLIKKNWIELWKQRFGDDQFMEFDDCTKTSAHKPCVAMPLISTFVSRKPS